MGGHVQLNSNKILVNRRKFKSRRRRRRTRGLKREFPVSLILQELYVSCKSVFKGPGVVPASSDIESLCKILDRMEPEDLGLSKNLQFFNPSLGNAAVAENVRVTYTNVYKCKNFSVVLFFLPATAVIPLHNHPDMTVFNKLLFGKIHVKSYDLVDSAGNNQHPSRLRLARLKSDTVYTAPCDTKVLYPKSGGNIHQLTAITPSLVLDVLGPPYSKKDDRDCTYYRDFPFEAIANGDSVLVDNEEDKYGWLEEIEMPEASKMDGIRYLGPRIIDDYTW